MIITTGSLKFKNIKTFKKPDLRPTSSKVRQALFNILRHKFKVNQWKGDIFFLDAFAGTGIVSFEALSRGIFKVTMIEKDLFSYKKILENINYLKVLEKTTILNEDFFKVNFFPYRYHLVYLDPPYYKNLASLAIDKIIDCGILKEKGLIICETEKSFKFNSKIDKYVDYTKAYGSIKLTFLKYF